MPISTEFEVSGYFKSFIWDLLPGATQCPWNPVSKATYLFKLTAVTLLQNNIPTAQKKAMKTLIEIEDMALLLAFLNLYQHAKTQLNSSHQS